MVSAFSPTAIYERFGTSSTGLTTREAEIRLSKNGENTLATQKKNALLIEYILKFAEPMTLILFCASIISLVIGQFTDAVIILVIVILSSTFEFIQEHAAQKALEKLRAQVATTATVIRDGKKHEIPTNLLTVGDIVELSCGDIIPADCRLISASDFFINESAITGESFPVEKSAESTDQKEFTVFMGTTVISGSARVVVSAIGVKTEFGKVSTSLSKQAPRSEFEQGVTSFGYFILKLSIFLILFIFLINAFKGGSVIEALLFAVAIAVGVVPELLPMIMTVTMAIGAQRMARKGVLVKQLSAIPNFGSMDVLCTDKTGTLTENKIALVKHIGIDGKNAEDVLLATFLTSHFQTGIKSPMDDAVLAYTHPDVHKFTKVDEIPYDFSRKRMSVLVKSTRRIELICKGAPEEVLALCNHVQYRGVISSFSPSLHTKTKKLYDELSAQGFRVLAVARKTTSATHVGPHDEKTLTLLGFVAFLDPAKKDVIGVVAHLNEIGIEMKVITGDNELVTKKICSDIGIKVKGLLMGRDIDALSDDALKVKSSETTIFARCSPDQKNRVILALKAAGHVVGYMGDGINDAPSLKNADVGISVNNAVDIAKESAQIVLTHKSLGELRDGVIEGRKTFANSMKYIMMACSSNLGNMFSATIAVLYLPFLPMLPLQIILNNFIYDFSQITIPTDNVDDEWTKKPRKWNLAFIRKYMTVFGPISSLFDILLFFILFGVMHTSAGTLQTAWFMESLATQTLGVFIIRTQFSPFSGKTFPSMSLLVSAIMCLLVGWILPYIPLGHVFSFEPISGSVLWVVIGLSVAYFATLEIGKRIFYKVNNY